MMQTFSAGRCSLYSLEVLESAPALEDVKEALHQAVK